MSIKAVTCVWLLWISLWSVLWLWWVRIISSCWRGRVSVRRLRVAGRWWVRHRFWSGWSVSGVVRRRLSWNYTNKTKSSHHKSNMGGWERKLNMRKFRKDRQGKTTSSTSKKNPHWGPYPNNSFSSPSPRPVHRRLTPAGRIYPDFHLSKCCRTRPNSGSIDIAFDNVVRCMDCTTRKHHKFAFFGGGGRGVDSFYYIFSRLVWGPHGHDRGDIPWRRTDGDTTLMRSPRGGRIINQYQNHCYVTIIILERFCSPALGAAVPWLGSIDFGGSCY